MVAPACWIPGLLFVFDFQGSSFNLAFSSNPLISASGTVSTGAPNEQVNFIPVNAAETEFIIQFSELPEPVDFSWSNNNPASPVQFAQAIANPGGGIFELVCSGTSSASIIETSTGLAITAWETQPGTPFSPLTYESFTGRVEQIFEFVPV
ncbi:hypothetical protein C8R45DRAFT_352872 [Mycena sanguinolenta]|nr:hypothetical protein C8R45DRAFT_352872 [Mycena sanguinolenta]